MGGLKQGTPDYQFVYTKFWNAEEGYDVDNYDGDHAIWSSRSCFKAEYDCKQFKQSVARMVAKIKGQRAIDDGNGLAMPSPDVGSPESIVPPPVQRPTPIKSPPVKSPPVKSPPIKSPPPPATPVYSATPSMSIGGIPFGNEELVSNDEYVLALPHHLFGWKDKMSNDRYTLVVYLPLGTAKEHIYPRISAGGTQVTVVLDWPDVMTNPLLPMYAGTTDGQPVYQNGHVKVASFQQAVKTKKKGDHASTKLKSVFCCDIPNTVEEQFCDFDVPAEVATIRYFIAEKTDDPPAPAQEALALVMELMCVRTNFNDAYNVQDFQVDFSKLSL